LSKVTAHRFPNHFFVERGNHFLDEPLFLLSFFRAAPLCIAM